MLFMPILTALILNLIKLNAQLLGNYIITPTRVKVFRISCLITYVSQCFHIYPLPCAAINSLNCTTLVRRKGGLVQVSFQREVYSLHKIFGLYIFYIVFSQGVSFIVVVWDSSGEWQLVCCKRPVCFCVI